MTAAARVRAPFGAVFAGDGLTSMLELLGLEGVPRGPLGRGGGDPRLRCGAGQMAEVNFTGEPRGRRALSIPARGACGGTLAPTTCYSRRPFRSWAPEGSPARRPADVLRGRRASRLPGSSGGRRRSALSRPRSSSCRPAPPFLAATQPLIPRLWILPFRGAGRAGVIFKIGTIDISGPGIAAG